MSSSEQLIIGLRKVKLSQITFQQGSVYVSVVLENGELVGVDVRYFIESGNDLFPTRNGFRIPWKYFQFFMDTIEGNYKRLNTIIFSMGSKNKTEFLIRYVKDKYGEGVDFRYYRRSLEFSGWEKRGIRMRNEDFLKFRRAIRYVMAMKGLAVGGKFENLFDGKNIVSWKDRPDGPNHLVEQDTDLVNESLEEILGM